MKKRIVSTLLVGILAVASVAGLSACDDVSVPKGDEVTADEWAEAFKKTEKVTNYTMDVSLNVESSAKGTVTKYNSSTEKKTIINTEGEGDLSTRTTIFYNMSANHAYMETSSKFEANGEDDGEKDKLSSKEVSKTYYEFSEKENDRDYYWKASYSLSERKSTDSRSSSEDDWTAKETSSFARNYITDMFSETMFYDTNNKDTAEASNIIGLYDKFTYADGIYTATLYRKVTVYSGIIDIDELVGCTVWVSFNKAESCVIGIGIKCAGNGTAYKADKYNVEYTYKGESFYSITDVNSTNVYEKVNKKKGHKDIFAAINKAKSKKAKNS